MVRSRRMVLDSDLAPLYGVTTKRLNEQVKRNRQRFPPDFMFRLTNQEVMTLRSQIATSTKRSQGGRRYQPYAFTEHGVVEALIEHADLRKRLERIERRLAKGFAEHEQELQEIRFLIAQLEQPIESKNARERKYDIFVSFVTFALNISLTCG